MVPVTGERERNVSKNRVIGLDIGTTAVRAAEVEVGSGGIADGKPPTVLRFGQVALPLGAVRDGEVAEPETVASALRQLWTSTKFSTREVVMGVGNQRVIVRELSMPAMPMAQVRSSLQFQVQDMLPVAVDDVLLDYYPTTGFQGQNGPQMKGLLVAATRDTVHANTAAVEGAGLRPLMVDLTAFALARFHSRGEHTSRPHALVDVGARVSMVVIVDNGMPQLVRLLPGGGQDATDAVANDLGVSQGEAEALKYQVGVGLGLSPETRPVGEAVARSTQNLVESIRNTLVYYSANHPGAGVEMVLLTGGGSRLAGFGQFLASATRLGVTYGEPLSAWRAGPAMARGEELAMISHALPVPVGLALGEAA